MLNLSNDCLVLSNWYLKLQNFQKATSNTELRLKPVSLIFTILLVFGVSNKIRFKHSDNSSHILRAKSGYLWFIISKFHSNPDIYHMVLKYAV